jgi:hypothetical protein
MFYATTTENTMQTAQIYNFPGDHPANRFPSMPHDSRSEWIQPGIIVPIAPELHMGIKYKEFCGHYFPIFKFWYQGTRIKDYTLDDNNQIDLRVSCQRLITRLSTQYIDNKPHKTLIVIENRAYRQ